MRFIGQFFSLRWDAARRGNRVNYNRGPVVVSTFLFFVFVVVGLVLTALGFDLAKVDVWLAAHNGWLLFIGDILFRLVCGLVLLLCGLCIASLTKGLRFAPPPLPQPLPLSEKAGRRRMPTTPAKIPKRNVAGKVLGILVCLIIGYFAFIGVIWIG